ncbi:voltage-gated hydrogen channel 1-like [Oppia nitens]|uniref:voltage-gated hydrogen channel 1-like n=1 Tax=Oppia nitens TaxID=1686743 RepID=UPI0023DABAAB|nr:voltage-gated hydrogen channel 1-like [Oppia nitens]
MYSMSDRRERRGVSPLKGTIDERRSLSDEHSSLNSCSADQSFRDNLKHLLHSYRFHLLIVALVIVDCIIVVIELMIDLQIYQTEVSKHTNHTDINDGHHNKAHNIAQILHYISIAILCIFVVEICLKMYAFRSEYIRHYAEIIDAFIVLTSLILDLIFINHEDILRYIGLVIILRLWRIVRVVHGIAISVKTPLEHSYEEEKRKRERYERELAEMHLYVNSLEIEIMNLRSLLKTKGIVDGVPQTYLKIDRKV